MSSVFKSSHNSVFPVLTEQRVRCATEQQRCDSYGFVGKQAVHIIFEQFHRFYQFVTSVSVVSFTLSLTSCVRAQSTVSILYDMKCLSINQEEQLQTRSLAIRWNHRIAQSIQWAHKTLSTVVTLVIPPLHCFHFRLLLVALLLLSIRIVHLILYRGSLSTVRHTPRMVAIN